MVCGKRQPDAEEAVAFVRVGGEAEGVVVTVVVKVEVAWRVVIVVVVKRRYEKTMDVFVVIVLCAWWGRGWW